MDLATLKRSAERLAALKEQCDAEREIRDRLIRQAMDAGATYKAAANAAGLKSVAQVSRIIGEG